MPAAKRPDSRLVRLAESWTSLPNPLGVPVEICASADVPIESAAIDELLTVLETARALRALVDVRPGLHDESRIDRVACTPDFRKVAGIPLGGSGPHGSGRSGVVGSGGFGGRVSDGAWSQLTAGRHRRSHRSAARLGFSGRLGRGVPRLDHQWRRHQLRQHHQQCRRR